LTSAADVVDLAQDRWHHTLTILGKGDKPAVVPLPPCTVDAVRSAVGDRQAGPLLLTRTGGRMTRGAAARIVTRLAVTAGIDKHLTPHASYTVMQYVSGAS
jgi:integrase/recombinase XerD